MHDSHKLWITIAVFLVIIGLLLGMYFTATPDKVGTVIKTKQSEKMSNIANKENEPQEIAYEDIAPANTVQEENELQDELKVLDLESINSENGGSLQEDLET